MDNKRAIDEKRDTALDVAKGIGIIFIVLSHATEDGQAVRNFLFAFHVPLFFILSGYFFKPDIRRILKRGRIWALVYLLLSLLDVAVLYVFNPALLTMDVLVKGLLCMDNQMIFNSPKWFLLVLFEVQIINCLFLKAGKRIRTLCVPLFLIAGFFCRRKLIFGITICIVATVFFYMGYVLHDKEILSRYVASRKKTVHVAAAVICFVLTYILSQWNGMVSMQNLQYGYYIVFLINALVGSAATILLGYALRESKLLAYYGKNTLIIFLTHYYIVRGIGITILPDLYTKLWGQLIITAVTMLVYVPVIFVWDKICRSRCFGLFHKREVTNADSNEK